MNRAALLLLSIAGCGAARPETGARFVREYPDGSRVEASFDRQWQAGHAQLRAEFDPATGRWVIDYTSDVSLDAALAATRAQTEAMARLLSDLGGLIQRAAALLGVPSAPETAP